MTRINARAGRKEWIALVVLILPLLLVSMDVSVLYFAVPFITKELDPSSAQQLWIFDIYGFVLAGTLITMGSLGDRIGRRKLLIAGSVAFGAASAVAAYASSADMLIVARGVLGVAGATLLPSTAALVRNMFHDEKQRQTAVAIWTAALTGGISLGPVLSGFLLDHFWWGSVFLVNVPFMLLLLTLGPLLVPESKDPKPGPFDLLSSVLLLLAMLPVVYGIKELATNGAEPLSLAAMAVGIAFALMFVLRQRRPEPMLELSMFKHRSYSGPLLVKLIAMFGLTGFTVFTTQYLQSVKDLSPLVAALWILIPSVGVGITAPVSAVLLQKGVHRAFLVSAGFAIGLVGFLVMILVEADSALWLVLTGATLQASGIVVVMTMATEMILGTVPPTKAGAAAATLETSAQLGGSLGIAILGSISAAVYRDEVVQGVPEGTPAGALAPIQDTLGGALVTAAQLPAEIGGKVVETARAAFVDGMHAAAVTGAVLIFLASVVSAITLRKVKVRTLAPDGSHAPLEGEDEPGQQTQPVREPAARYAVPADHTDHGAPYRG
ncbi:MFS transporter [Streptomyces yangpuensis]|uniref:MFS transporter n=1 Tax=Streptomyces yangpuensis TaxID=1648182 RepID=UPI0035DB879C